MFFEVVDAMGDRTTIALGEYERLVPAALRAALASAGLVARGAPLRSLRCEDGGCLREIVDEDDAIGRYLAVCERSPAVCPPEPVDAATLATARLVPGALARTLSSLYALAPAPAADVERASAETPVLLGVQSRDDGARDVFWLRRPEATAVRALLLERERGARATTLLVPTTRGLPSDWATRWSTSHVEIDVLAEAVVLRGETIALAPRLRVVRAAPEAAANVPLAASVPVANVAPAPITKPRGRLAALPTLERWPDLHIYAIDPETVLVRIGRTHVRRTAIDFGEADAGSRAVTVQWKALVAMCAGNGHWRWKSFGNYGAVKTMVYRLRTTMREVFGLRDDPFHPYSHDWLPRFRCYASPPEFSRDEAMADGDTRDWQD